MLNNMKDQSTGEEVFDINNITCKMTPFTFGFVSCILQQLFVSSILHFSVEMLIFFMDL